MTQIECVGQTVVYLKAQKIFLVPVRILLEDIFIDLKNIFMVLEFLCSKATSMPTEVGALTLYTNRNYLP